MLHVAFELQPQGELRGPDNKGLTSACSCVPHATQRRPFLSAQNIIHGPRTRMLGSGIVAIAASAFATVLASEIEVLREAPT